RPGRPAPARWNTRSVSLRIAQAFATVSPAPTATPNAIARGAAMVAAAITIAASNSVHRSIDCSGDWNFRALGDLMQSHFILHAALRQPVQLPEGCCDSYKQAGQ